MHTRERVAIIGGVRTPFVKAGTLFKDLSFQQMGAHVLRALVNRYSIKEDSIDIVVMGAVLLDPRTPNWAREMVFKAGLPKSVYAHSVSNNCISGLVAVTNVCEGIALGSNSLGIAGGSESMSNPALLFREKNAKIFRDIARARSLSEKIKLFAKFPFQLCPELPGITEPSTGLTMGQHMEITAQKLSIPRRAQDELALQSHVRAHQATIDKRLTAEIEPLNGATKDLTVRGDTSLEKLAKLPPVFDTSGKGTLTAGNSSPLTDGASCVLLMSEARAKNENREVLAYIADYEYAAISPDDGLLMAPGVAVPRLLERNGLTLKDFDLIEIHEAFAAQVLANLKVWEEGWKEGLVGKVSMENLNVMGGSIAVGHPFAATGGRIVTSLANELKRRNAKRGLISICAAGAMAGAMILERG